MDNGQLTAKQLDEIDKLTREYASYSRDSAGLGDVLGGLAFFATAHLWISHDSWITRIVVVCTPLFWIAAKEWLQRHYYQTDGRVEPKREIADRLAFGAFAVTSILSVIGLGIELFLNARGGRPEAYAWVILALLIVLALAVLVLRFLRSANEYFVGLFLIINAACAISGVNVMLRSLFYVVALVCSMTLIIEGWNQHRKFQKTRERLSFLRSLA